MKKARTLILILIVAVISGCGSDPTTAEDNTGKPEKEPANEGLVMTKEQLIHADLAYGSIVKQKLSNVVNARGELIVPVNAIADIVSIYPGIVKTVYVKQGDKVNAGQLLATIKSPEMILKQQEYLQVKNELSMLRTEYERQKELNKDKIASDKYFQNAQSEYNVALAAYNSLALQIEMAGIDRDFLDQGNISPILEVKSSLGGYVEQIDVNPGKYIPPEQRIMQVINRDKLLIELNVFEKDIMKVAPGQRVTFTLSNLDKTVHEASIITIGNTVRPETRIVKVLAGFDNAQERMLPGMFVASEIHAGENEMNALPEEAVLRLGDNHFVVFYSRPEYQNAEQTKFFYVQVKPGRTDNGYIEVSLLSNLPEDALIVVKGGYFLKTELAKQEE